METQKLFIKSKTNAVIYDINRIKQTAAYNDDNNNNNIITIMKSASVLSIRPAAN